MRCHDFAISASRGREQDFAVAALFLRPYTAFLFSYLHTASCFLVCVFLCCIDFKELYFSVAPALLEYNCFCMTIPTGIIFLFVNFKQCPSLTVFPATTIIWKPVIWEIWVCVSETFRAGLSCSPEEYEWDRLLLPWLAVQNHIRSEICRMQQAYDYIFQLEIKL